MITKSERATQIVRQLKNSGFEAYWVGGSVRDILLKRQPKDYDIVTNAPPEAITDIFPKHFEVGKQFGVISVVLGNSNFEVATFRAEADYADRRRPNKVSWSSAEEDVKRRDFTINGLLYDPVSQSVTDFVDGQRDLQIKIIRFIGRAEERVKEDPLRMLRAIRLKNELNFQYDKDTYDAIKKYAPDITHVAWERIRTEFDLMFRGEQRLEAFLDLDRLGFIKILLPEVENLKGTPQPQMFHAEGDVFDHVVKAIKSIKGEVPSFLVWAVMLHDIAKPEVIAYPTSSKSGRITTHGHAQASAELAREILDRFRLPRTEVEAITWMIAHHMSLKKIDRMRPAKREKFLLDHRFRWLLELHHADALGKIPEDLSLYQEVLKLYKRMHELKAKSQNTPLVITGEDLKQELGLEPGPKIGEILERIRDAQLEGKVNNKKEALELAQLLA